MNAWDWLDHHWFVGGWCAIALAAGFASILRGFGRFVGGTETHCCQHCHSHVAVDDDEDDE